MRSHPLPGRAETARFTTTTKATPAQANVVKLGSKTAANAYRFVWAMGGENQRFDDMDKFPITDLR